MARPTLSDSEFIKMFRALGAAGMSRKTGTSERGLYARRARLEQKMQKPVRAETGHPHVKEGPEEHPGRLLFDVPDGVVLVASDAHYWPGIVTAAHKAFVRFCRVMKPKLVIMNGDVLDGATVSRHAPIGWESRPKLTDEIDACKARLFEIEKVTKNVPKVWTLGNHDARFETRLATVAPEYAKIHGVHLQDHFPDWKPCWSAWINDALVVKHRNKSGIHAPHNNTMWAGKSIATGHLHSLKVMPISDYNGTRWGVDTGTLAEPTGPMFRGYLEDNAVNWRSGFAVFTFRSGRLMWPEVVSVIGKDMVDFRGEMIGV